MNTASARRPLALRMEYASAQDQFSNYCLWPYEPVAPVDGKWSSANLLFHTFEVAGLDERAYEIVDRIRAALGIGNTVWGLKLLGDGTLGWEFYFYDYRRRQRERSLSRVLAAIRPLVGCNIVPNETLHYFMFSLDFDQAVVTGARDLDMVHLYLGNPGSTVSSGVSYGLTTRGRELENFYFFYKPRVGVEGILGKVLCSAFIEPAEFDSSEILWPELADCDTICVANKRFNDCIYFSGVNLAQFLFALKELRYPAPLVDFIESNRGRLDHLLFDIGFDYHYTTGGLCVLKSGYYGTF